MEMLLNVLAMKDSNPVEMEKHAIRVCSLMILLLNYILSNLDHTYLDYFLSLYLFLMNILSSFPLVHPCDKETKGGCDQICVKNGEKHTCACNAPEFKLGDDGKKCDKGKRHIGLRFL